MQRLTALTVLLVCVGAVTLFWTNEGQSDVVDINATGPDGHPILFWQVKQRDPRAVGALLDAGANIEARGFFDATPVITAGSANSWEMVELLMSRGADPRAADGKGFNLPWLASTSKIREGTAQHTALQRVIAHLKKSGMMARIYTPPEAKTLVKQGAWPPAELR